MSEKPSSAVPRRDAAIAFALASLASIGALAAVSAIPGVDTLRDKEQAFIAWAFSAAALFFVGVAYAVARKLEGAVGVRTRAIFLVAALYSGLWAAALALLSAAESKWNTQVVVVLGLLFGAMTGAAFAALASTRPSTRMPLPVVLRLALLSVVPALVVLAVWIAASALAYGWGNVDALRPQLAIAFPALGVACGLIAAPLLRALRLSTTPTDRS